MIMPIVCLKKMAMNESIAATCCYRQMATPSTVYWEVLNGGFIGAGYVDFRSLKNSTWQGWTVLDFDLSGLTSSTNLPNLVVTYNTNGTKTYSVDGVTTTLDSWLASNKIGVTRGGYCNHKESGPNICAYYNQEPVYKINQHFTATVKHGNFADWDKPHDSMQFNS